MITTPVTTTGPCHNGNVLAFEQANIKVYGGGSSRGFNPYAVDIWINLNGASSSRKKWKFPEKWLTKDPLRDPVVIDMEISDYHAPVGVGKEFWSLLWNDLVAEAKSKEALSVLVSCTGGHGRTGLVLTALAIAAGAVGHDEIDGKDLDPVDWLRSVYCDQAVESNDQIGYLEQTFGFTSPAQPPKKAYTPTVHIGGSTYSPHAPLNTYSPGVLTPLVKGQKGKKWKGAGNQGSFAKESHAIAALEKNLRYIEALTLEMSNMPQPQDKWGELTFGQVEEAWDDGMIWKDKDCPLPDCKRAHPHLDSRFSHMVLWAPDKSDPWPEV